MAGDAQRKGGVVNGAVGKILLHQPVPLFTRLRVARIGGQDEGVPAEAFFPFRGEGFEHRLLGGAEAADLFEGVQLAALDLQNGLDAQRVAQHRAGGGDPAALFEVAQGIDRDEDAGVKGGAVELRADLRRCEPAAPEQHRVIDRLAEGGRDPLVVGDKDPPRVFRRLRQPLRDRDNAAQAAGHGNVDDRLRFRKELVPGSHRVARRGH